MIKRYLNVPETAESVAEVMKRAPKEAFVDFYTVCPTVTKRDAKKSFFDYYTTGSC